jgi:hypothetical protein
MSDDQVQEQQDPQTQVDLPETQKEEFVAEFRKGEMELSTLKDKLFCVSVNSGDRNKPKFLCSQIRGPFSFYEMVEYAGKLFANNMMHAKIVTLTKDIEEKPQFLDAGTVDYIEAHYQDIIIDGMLEGAGPFAEIEKTIEPGFIKDSEE